jgi:adenosylcobinamide-phosphate synthase
LAENLSDGVIAPLFWYALLGVPGMLAYKMVNTLDSMIGYRNERYKDFGCFAARLDDVANYLPARITAILMVLASGKWSLLKFVWKYGNQHASPNSGYPEAALAGILNCRFGGPHHYFGQEVWKPFIGFNERLLNTRDMQVAIRINRLAEVMMVVVVLFLSLC